MQQQLPEQITPAHWRRHCEGDVLGTLDFVHPRACAPARLITACRQHALSLQAGGDSGSLMNSGCGVPMAVVTIAALVTGSSSPRGSRDGGVRSLVTRRVQPLPMPTQKSKFITATRRLPMWKLSDEMYLHRQLAPDPSEPWTAIKRSQSRMKDRIREQQLRDMRTFQLELAGWRLPPTHPIGSLRRGMWLDGRVAFLKDFGIMVDVGAYSARGDWCDGYVPLDQLRDDGGYVGKEDIQKHVYLGEHVRVRVMECTPATGKFLLSMRSKEDLPELFLGEPRPFSIYDLRVGMKLTGVVRRVFDRMALVDIGAEQLARLSVYHHKKPVDEYGMPMQHVQHERAADVYVRGACLDVWVKRVDDRQMRVTLDCNPVNSNDAWEPREQSSAGVPFQAAPVKMEHMTPAKQKDLEKQQAETEDWDPYVPHVTEWLDSARIEDDEIDSWVAEQEQELFQDDDMVDEYATSEGAVGDSFANNPEDFADDDDFADLDFLDDQVGSSSGTRSFDDWELDDA
mmetsp:Transcript_59840/g.110806  ORF Transcript_59840/g.110806 Transcript_59840/m.110806 type:complete len:512 (-) Transcript_59840:31-1566(-)